MVSKLLLAVQENIYSGVDSGVDSALKGRLIDHYYEIQAGIGINKSPALYGAFPTDPYSHTPRNKGVQQPGMTGQVKEDIISRWAELGIYVSKGCLYFNPLFLNHDEFLSEDESFSYFSLDGEIKKFKTEKDELVFTYCQVPVIYRRGNKYELNVEFTSGSQQIIDGNKLPENISNEIFSRYGQVKLIRVQIRV
jgi:hypothetical protein